MQQILPTALPTWKSAKDDFIAEAEAKLKADHLMILKLYRYLPAWSLGMEALPDFLKPFIEDIIELKRTQALDFLSLIEKKLKENAQHYATRAEAQFMSVDYMYCVQNNDEKGWITAKDLLGALIDRETIRYMEGLEHELKYIQNHPVKDADLTQLILEGPKRSLKQHHKTRRHYHSSSWGKYPSRGQRARRDRRYCSRSDSYYYRRNNTNVRNRNRNWRSEANSHYNYKRY